MKTLHLVAALLFAITIIQLVVFVALMHARHPEGDGGEHAPPHGHSMGEAAAGLGPKGAGSDDDATSGKRGTMRQGNPDRQTVGLRVINNLAKIRSIVDSVSGISSSDKGFVGGPPMVPDNALLVRADGRYDPRKAHRSGVAPSAGAGKEDAAPKVTVHATIPTVVRKESPDAPRRSDNAGSKTAKPVVTNAPPASAEKRHHEEVVSTTQRAYQQPTTRKPTTVRSPQRPQQNQQQHQLPYGGNKYPIDSDDFVPVMGDIFEREGRALEQRVQQDVHLQDMLMVSRPATALTHLREAAIVVLGYNRPHYLRRTLQQLVANVELSKGIKKYVSIDGNDPATISVARSFGGEAGTAGNNKQQFGDTTNSGDDGTVELLVHERRKPPMPDPPGTAYVAAHYKWVLDHLFKERGHSHVIVVEDDLLMSKDALQMFEALAPLLAMDPSVWCVSSWNDNGFHSFTLPQNEFFRTSVFPGLGWMLRRELWMDELSDNFPLDNWDHWMRVATTSKRRDCIVPWVSRNKNIGEDGTTADSEFYQLYIGPIVAIDEAKYTFKPYGDLSYLLSYAYYERFRKLLLDSSTAPKRRLLLARDMMPLTPMGYVQGMTYVVGYTRDDYEHAAAQLLIHTSPRAMFRHAAWLRYNGADIILVNRQLSPFADSKHRIRKDDSLVAVVASEFGESCTDTCREFGGGGVNSKYRCEPSQFGFINDCKVLSRYVPSCGAHYCTQAWGSEVPAIEADALAKGGRPPMCLESEMQPSCEAYHQHTKRLCPCVRGYAYGGGDGGAYNGAEGQPLQQQQQRREPPPHQQQGNQEWQHPAYRPYQAPGNQAEVPNAANNHYNDNTRQQQQPGKGSHLAIVPAEQRGLSCHEVCQSYTGGANTPYGVKGWRCGPQYFVRINECSVLQKYFPCESCHESRGNDIPNYVSHRDDGQYGRCLLTEESMTCEGSHHHTQRICPCIPE